ncbi:hypothetical protein AB0O28_15110 [Microbispora sp. NPDC088329]|uniref:hypothetical protein n=1 Tax=Microbispora sp. NPDC088329 TaxID=3154869 RepID=UPI00342B246D
MPLCTAAVLAAALLSGPAAVPPDPAPSGTRATTDKNNATPPSTARPQLASLPGMAPQAGEFPFPFPQAPPWMAPNGTDSGRNASGPASGSPAGSQTGSQTGASAPGASGANGKPVAGAGRPSATAGGTGDGTAGDTESDRADDGAATANTLVPVIDPKTRDVFIQPVIASGKPGEAPRPFTFRPVYGVQTTKSYPAPQREPKTARQKTATRPHRHLWPRGR